MLHNYKRCNYVDLETTVFSENGGNQNIIFPFIFPLLKWSSSPFSVVRNSVVAELI